MMGKGDILLYGAAVVVGVAVVWYFFLRPKDEGEFVADLTVLDASLEEGDTVDCTIDEAPVQKTALEAGVKLAAGPHELKVNVADSLAQLKLSFAYQFVIKLKTRTRVVLSDAASGTFGEPIEEPL